MALAGVEVVRNTRVDRALVERERPDLVIAATGATPTGRPSSAPVIYRWWMPGKYCAVKQNRAARYW